MNTLHTTGKMLVVLAALGTLIPSFAFGKNPHTPSGLRDSKGNTLYVESALTPDAFSTALLAPTTVNTQTQNMVQSAVVQQSSTLGPNLIANPSVETAGSNGLPASWLRGGYGTNTRTFTYPATPAQDGSKAAQVAITSYSSGDAKWYFNNVSVTPGQTYQFSDWSFGTVPSEIDVQLKMSDGTFKYLVLANPPASSSYQQTTRQFTVPAGAVTLTVFHLINRVGNLTVDNYSLNQVSAPQPPPNPNLVSNGDFETAGPAGWNRGGWGSNTRAFTYPAAGVDGGKAAQVTVSNYQSGDAKWYFTPIALQSGVYIYTDSYLANVPSIVTLQLHKTDGSFIYTDIAQDPASASFKTQSIGFVVPQGIQDITIYHLIKQNGTLTIDNVSIVKDTNTQGIFQTGAVTLTFDNGWLSQYQNAVPKMNQYGFKGTFYIITHEIADNGFPGFMSKTQIKDIFNMGMEIGSHTQTHPYLTQLPPEQQVQEINGSRQDLLTLNVGPINSFAYPYGDYDAAVLQEVKDAGYTNARTTITGYTTPSSDHYQLPRQVVLNTTSVAQMESWVNEAAADRVWLIIEFHQVDESGNTYAITPANFNQFIDFLAQKGVPVITMEQGVANLNH
jgi:peptidoglycan/xylan/chitin deacetylase (PgdA/CDA1 family)